MYNLLFKRILDIVITLSVMIMTAPVTFTAALLLLAANRGRIFFIQQRPGRNGKPFNIIKFKTMSDRADQAGQLLPDSERLHGIGKVIRQLSIDELPQLINVLKGDMSIVGPRPLLMEYLPFYSREQAKRHNVRPGITGWAQVNGRNALSWEDKFKLDVWYVDNISLALDLKILWLTLLKVTKSEGISQSGHATAEKFKGNL